MKWMRLNCNIKKPHTGKKGNSGVRPIHPYSLSHEKRGTACSIQFLSNIHHGLVDCIFGNNLHYVIQSSAVCVDVEVDWLGEIQAEDTHDGFCIDHISSGY